MNEIKILLTKERLQEVAEELQCNPSQVEKILNAYFQNDVSSKDYRNLLDQSFDLDTFLLSKSPAELMLLRASALSRKGDHFTPKKVVQQKLQ